MKGGASKMAPKGLVKGKVAIAGQPVAVGQGSYAREGARKLGKKLKEMGRKRKHKHM
jgi:hypothetical protein